MAKKPKLTFDEAWVLWTQSLQVSASFGTDVVDDQACVEYERRKGRCFELAGLAMLSGMPNYVGRAMLVHGRWKGPGAEQYIAHAWIKIRLHTDDRQDVIWEPITMSLFPKEVWDVVTNSIEEVSYSEDAMRKMILIHENWGCWHDTKGAT